ncbi:MAG: flagellar basal-body rod protein FlgB [Bacillota bacterium]|nr:flagellar basal-body rod protein FlgB [Bacillota bacterium]
MNFSLLNKSLDGLWLRQQITMDNIANYSTPDYKSKFVDFESQLKSKIKSISDGNLKSYEIDEQIDDSNIIIGENDNQTLRLDGNNVDLEKENLNLAKTQIQYMYTITELNSYFSKLRSVISEGKK